MVHLRDLVAFRDDVIKLRVAFGNRIGAKKEKGDWTFVRKYSTCKNSHIVLLKDEEKREKCPICGEPVRIVEETPSDDLIQRYDVCARKQQLPSQIQYLHPFHESCSTLARCSILLMNL